MNSITPSVDRLACIGHDVSLAPQGEKLQTFADRADTFGKLVRKGFFTPAALEQKLWDVARAYSLSGSPGSESEEHIADVIDKAIAIDDEPRANGHDDDEPPPPAGPDDYGSPPIAPTGPALSKKPYKLVLARDVTIEGTVKSFLIDGFLGRDEISIWYGPPECGKSTAKIDAACHVATGRPWCGRAVLRGPVLYVAAERGQTVKRRILAWRLEHGIDDFPLAVIDDTVDLRTGTVDTDRILAAAAELAKVSGQKVVWIIFDTLSRVLAAGDENSSRDMGLLVQSIDRIYRETGAHCSLVHHMPLAGDRMRGHGLANGAGDTTIKVEKKDGIVTASVAKASDLPEDEKPAMSFRFKSITVSEQPHRTASVMIQAEDQAASGTKSKQGKLSDRQKLALDALNSCAADVGKPPPAIFGLPQGLIAITIDQWRDELFRRGIISKDQKNPRTAFQQIREGLEARAAAAERDGFIWKV
jgi:AAA domain